MFKFKSLNVICYKFNSRPVLCFANSVKKNVSNECKNTCISILSPIIGKKKNQLYQYVMAFIPLH